MAGSFKKIDYRLRPAKHAERTMLIDLYKRMRFAQIETYQYIGFGSVAFVDFRMVYRSLGIRDLISIEEPENEEEEARFQKNKPYEGIDLRFGNSNVVLPGIAFDRHSLVWLDYDGRADRAMANDLTGVAARMHSGSFLAFTFTDDFPTSANAAQAQLQAFKEGFPEFVAGDATALQFQGARYAEFVRTTFGALLQTSLSDADAGEEDPRRKRVIKQVCYFKYKDTAPMATVGWIIVDVGDLNVFDSCGFEGLPFVRTGADPYRIKIPFVTTLEIREMEKRLPDLGGAVDLDWIPENERAAFMNTYRYLPNYAPVELI